LGGVKGGGSTSAGYACVVMRKGVGGGDKLRCLSGLKKSAVKKTILPAISFVRISKKNRGEDSYRMG